MNRKHLIDWQRLTLNLRKKQSLRKTAEQIGCAEHTLQRLARGDCLEPTFSLGVLLVDLHYDLFPDQHDTIKCN